MVNICHIIINNPNNKEEFLKKMKEIEDIEDHEINVQVEPSEEITQKESKRKVQFRRENEEIIYNPTHSPCKIGIPDNRNLYMERRHRKACRNK